MHNNLVHTQQIDEAPEHEARLGRAVRALLEQPETLSAIQDKVNGLAERLDGIEHHLAGHGRRLEQFEQIQREQTQAVRALYEKQGLLEEASRQNARLTDEHYAEHIVLPLAHQLAELLALTEGCLENGAAADRDALTAGVFDLLGRYGVEPMTAAEGDQFDPALMQPFVRVPTSDHRLDRVVHSMIRRGFRYGRRILRPVSVRLYRYERDEAA